MIHLITRFFPAVRAGTAPASEATRQTQIPGITAVVVANCQARPISWLLPQMHPALQMLEPVVVHLAQDSDAAEHAVRFDQADVIFAQRTSASFKPRHLTTDKLRSVYGDKVITWPNIFYLGQQPYLRYLTHATAGRMMGPLEALHDMRLYRSWIQTGQVNPQALQQSDPDYILAVRENSLASLRTMEADCDVIISDVIQKHQHDQRLFFTFNHPTLFVLTSMARRLLDRRDLAARTPEIAEEIEPLGRYCVPSLWPGSAGAFQGDAVSLEPGRPPERLPGKPVQYSPEALCALFQQFYDADPCFADLARIRLTPELALDAAFRARAVQGGDAS